jgi:formylmethanofuran:tetrahydromethanopterin formyltransferase
MGLKECFGEGVVVQALGSLEGCAGGHMVALREVEQCALQAGIRGALGGLQQTQVHAAAAAFGCAVDAGAAVGAALHQVSR